MDFLFYGGMMGLSDLSSHYVFMSFGCALFIYTTLPSQKEAEDLARGLLEKKAAACIHIFPSGVSFFMWEEKMQSCAEVTVLIKTVPTHARAVLSYLKKHHPYRAPFVGFWDIHCSDQTQTWLQETLLDVPIGDQTTNGLSDTSCA